MIDDIPTYPWFDQVPEGLLTRNQLAAQGLRPGGPVRAQVIWRRGRRYAELFRLDEALPKRPMTEAQQRALDAARQKRSEAMRTCPVCRTVFPFLVSHSDECPICYERQVRIDRISAAKKARRWLANPTAVVIDTETTDLDGYLVEIAVIDMRGQVLLDTLVNPQHPISEGAYRVHGIDNTALVDAPTYAELHERLSALLQDRRVIAYNAPFDKGILRNEAIRLLGTPAAGVWLRTMRWACAMRAYAAWYGDWSESRGAYRWHPLGGGHRALGDALACLERINIMAQGDSDETT